MSQITSLPLNAKVLTEEQKTILLNTALQTLYWISPILNPKLGQVEPPDEYKRDGMLAYADGTNWNPIIGGKGYYRWNATTPAWEKVEGSGSGSGDMLKSTYDPNIDGIIALAQLDPAVSTFDQTDHDTLPNPHHSNANDPTSDQKAALVGTSGTPSSTNKYVTDLDARNTDARTPTSHASTHTNGTDDIQSATSGQKGLMTATQASKLDGIEAGADVTDAVNVAAVVHGVAAKSPLVDNDEIPIIDSEASNVLKKSLWSVVKSTLKTYFDTLYNLYVHPNHSGDVTSVADGAQTIAAGAVTLAKMADMATASLIYRKTAGAGVPEVNSLATLKTDLNIPNDFDDLTDGTTNKAFTATEKTKLSGIAEGAEVNVNADWNASSGDAQILNKPSTMAPSSHNNSAHSDTYITVAAVTDANLSTSDVTTNDVSTSKHGFCPKAPNDTAKFLRGDGTWNTPSGGSAAQILHCQDQKTAPADGGSSVAGIQVRVFNTVVLNEISGASLASNQITLPAGTYEVYAFGPTYAAGTTQAGIYNVTDSAYTLMGTNSYDIAGAFVQGKFTLAATKVMELRQFTQTARAGNGLGVSANSGIGKEVFGNILLRKV